ncbi:Uma2 family endonuclease [Halomicronema sp. CCY15110]|uniref:Uma2 family endonuclease n=1 Tax=Halomicronema sp. CCY15110 TaxID=2767773 RepID=UPI001EF318C8|nr:Uma2 family endonuclease [Halomicronema sp. CCY15110]
MATTQAMQPMVLHQLPELRMSDGQFFQFCQDNPAWNIERSAAGEILVMSPTGAETGERNFDLIGQLWLWTKRDGRGKGFDSSTGFRLPNGAVRSPDAAWVLKSRWEALSPQERQGFPLLCPDFVLELRSPTDLLVTLQDKMQEYLANGAQLGWLIDPLEGQVWVYRPHQAIAGLAKPQQVLGDPVLAGFGLDLRDFWGEG